MIASRRPCTGSGSMSIPPGVGRAFHTEDAPASTLLTLQCILGTMGARPATTRAWKDQRTRLTQVIVASLSCMRLLRARAHRCAFARSCTELVIQRALQRHHSCCPALLCMADALRSLLLQMTFIWRRRFNWLPYQMPERTFTIGVETAMLLRMPSHNRNYSTNMPCAGA